MAVLAVMIWLWGASSSSVKYEPFGLIFVELGCCHTAEERRELWILFVIKVDQWLLSGLAQVWLQFYFLQFMAVCEIGSNNTRYELSHSLVVFEDSWWKDDGNITGCIKPGERTDWGRDRNTEQIFCDIWAGLVPALNVGRALLWLCPGPAKTFIPIVGGPDLWKQCSPSTQISIKTWN